MSVEETFRAELDKRDEAIKGFMADEIQPIIDKLNALQDDGTTKASDESVKELEKRLEEKEVSLKELSEELRGFITQHGVNDDDDPYSKKSDEKYDFNTAGVLVKDKKALADAVIGCGGSPKVDMKLLSTAVFPPGAMPPEWANAFIDNTIADNPTLQIIQVMRQVAPKRNIDEMRIGRRTMRKHAENTDDNAPSGVGPVQRVTDCIPHSITEDLTLEFMEDNIETGRIEGTIQNMIQKSFVTQENDLGWNGDEDMSTGTIDSFVNINNGWLKLARADGDVSAVDLSSFTLAGNKPSEVLSAVFKELMSNPDKTRFASLFSLVYFCPVVFALNYAEEVSARETQMGDDVLINGFPGLRYFGRRVFPDPAFNTVATDTAARSVDTIFMSPAENLIWAIQRQMTMDSEWKPRPQRTELTFTARTDFEYASGEPIVLGNALDASYL